MKNLLELHSEAEQSGVSVTFCHLPACGSLALKGHIGLDTSLSNMEERVHLAHEIGHCETGSFYNRYSPFDIRQKHEYRANKWAIKKLIPKDELEEAVRQGYTEVWELADHFGVTEDFMAQTIDFYKNVVAIGFE